jgi:hypothetical protein
MRLSYHGWFGETPVSRTYKNYRNQFLNTERSSEEPRVLRLIVRRHVVDEVNEKEERHGRRK